MLLGLELEEFFAVHDSYSGRIPCRTGEPPLPPGEREIAALSISCQDFSLYVQYSPLHAQLSPSNIYTP